MPRHRAAGAVLAGALLLPSCFIDEEPDDPWVFTKEAMVYSIYNKRKELGLLEQAKKGKPDLPTVLYIDMASHLCRKEHEKPTPYEVQVLHDPRSSWIPDEKYAEFAYYCFEHRMWYYRYISADTNKDGTHNDVTLGPYFVDDREPIHGGPAYRRGGPRQAGETPDRER